MRFLSITLAANDVKSFDVSGGYFEIIDSAGKINVAFTDVSGTAASDNAMVDALSGTFALGRFSRFDITERTGNPQTVTVMYGPSTGGTRRQPGIVQVIDTNKARTIAGQAFIANAGVAAVAAQYARAGIWNPAASGVRGVVEKIYYSSTTPQTVYVGYTTVALATIDNSPRNKRLNQSGPAAIKRAYDTNAAFGLNTTAAYVLKATASDQVLDLKTPIAVDPGVGLTVYCANANTDLSMNMDFSEEAMT